MNNSIDWPTLLNSFAIISSDLITISKVLRDKNAANLRNTIFVPKSFSEDVDASLQVNFFCIYIFFFFELFKTCVFEKQVTQNRMSVFNYDLIPHILRTKLSPDLEEKENQAFKLTREFDMIKNHEVPSNLL
jgi:mediator of RNA polymerase II transcription subunit 8